MTLVTTLGFSHTHHLVALEAILVTSGNQYRVHKTKKLGNMERGRGSDGRVGNVYNFYWK